MSSVIFLDSRVLGVETLLAVLDKQTQVILLDADTDGVEQIVRALSGLRNLDAIHIVSHGTIGTLYLGSAVLTVTNLSGYQTQFAEIGGALSTGGDILLYGYDVGAGTSGQSFIDKLAYYTRADIAASNDYTGHWVLEAASDSIEVTFPFDIQAVEDYSYALAAAGALDTTFGSNGIAPIGAIAGDRDLILQPDGKMLVAGISPDVSGFALARFNADGSVDTTLGGGTVITYFEQASEGHSVALQPDGRIVMAGSISTGSEADFAIARYTPDGSLDTTFGGNGKVTTSLGGFDRAHALAVQGDGKIVVAGYSSSGNQDFALARYNSDGSLDTTFGSGGKVITNLGGDDVVTSIALQPDGRIVVAGYTGTMMTGNDFAVVRYNLDGSLDTSFGGDGAVTTHLGGSAGVSSLALQADGKILVAGSSFQGTTDFDFALIRYNSDGSLDPAFSGDGKLTTNFHGRDMIASLGLQPDGRIVVAGSTISTVNNQYPVFTLARYKPDGSLDTTFDGDGKLTVSTSDFGSFATGVAIQGDTKILASGSALVRVLGIGDSPLNLTGSSTEDWLYGQNGNDTLSGLGGDDTFYGFAGNDTLNGGAGIDTAVFNGARASYGFSGTSFNATVTGSDGSDTLSDVERLQFSDMSLAIDLDSGQAASNTVRIIGAAFDAPAIHQHPDWVGTGLDLFDSGMSMQAVGELVVQILGLSNTAFVDTVYQNVVGTPPSDSERAFYLGLLQGSGGTMTQGQLLELAANVSINEQNINLVGLQQSGVEFV